MIWVRKTENEIGGYTDAEGVRYSVEWCVKIVTPDGSTEIDHGYERHVSVESACAAWGLEPYISPEDLAMQAEMAESLEQLTEE